LGSASEKLVPTLLSQLKQPKHPADANMLLIALVPHRALVGNDIAEVVFADQKGNAGPQILVPVLQKFGEDLVEPVKKHLASDNPSLRKRALQIIPYLPVASGEKLVPLIAPLLKSNDSAVVVAALTALERFGSVARPAVPDMVTLLDGPNGPKIRKQIEQAVLRIQPDPKDAEAILKKFREKASLTPQDRAFAVEIALTVPGKGKEAADLLEPLVSEKNPGGDVDLQRLLSKLGPDAAGLVPALHKQIKTSPHLLESFEKSLRRIGPAAKVVLPDVYERLKAANSTDNVLKLCKIVYTLDPDQRKVADERLTQVFGEHLDKFWWGMRSTI
jgi:hypothetical protein